MDRASLELVVSLTSLTRDRFDDVVEVLRSQGLTRPKCTMRLDDFEYRDLGEAPEVAFDRCLAEGALDLFMEMWVDWNGGPVRLSLNFDFEGTGFMLSLESVYIYEREAVLEPRLRCFFALSREIARVLEPLYGIVGAEGFIPSELQPGEVERFGLQPFSMSILDEEALEQVRHYYAGG